MYIELVRLGHRYASSPWLFRELSGTLVSGRTYALTGPSGSGKSTFLGVLAGWVPPIEGRVDAQRVQRTSWVFQNPYGVARRPALDHVAHPYLVRGWRWKEAEAAALTLLTEFGLEHVARRVFATLSGGEAQRLMLARAVARNPDLLLIDEPTAQLDGETARDVNAVIHRLADHGRIVVIATHDERTRDSCSEVLDLRVFQPGPDPESRQR